MCMYNFFCDKKKLLLYKKSFSILIYLRGYDNDDDVMLVIITK